jgi:peptide/nickel transport system ATP-binding protein
MSNTSPILQIENLSISLPRGADRSLAVQDVSLDVLAGQTTCIVGESGSGKSMIASAVMGLLAKPYVAPAGGKIIFEGSDILHKTEEEFRKLRGVRLGMIFQEPMTSLNPVMRIGEQIGEVLDAHVSLSRAERQARILSSLRDVGLPSPEKIANSYPFRLSGGQRQRVMIAAAMVLEPTLLIADEPTTALDVTTQAQILKLMREIQTRKKMAMIFITHDFGVVAEIADQVLVMKLGKVVEKGVASEVLRSPQHEYTRSLIAAIPKGAADPAKKPLQAKSLLQVTSLKKIFTIGRSFFGEAHVVKAIDDVSFDLRKGETLGLVGESGSGKSTIGRSIVGLLRGVTGEMSLEGENVPSDIRKRSSALRARIQMVFQDPYASLNPRQTIAQALIAGPVQMGMSGQDARERAAGLLDRVGLKRDALDRYPHEFSGGQRQRVAIARALIMQPDIIVADEAVSALDVSVQAQVLALFKEVKESFGLTMLFITHDLRVAADICDRIAVLQNGKLVEIGTVAEIIASPKQDYTRQLIQSSPNFHTMMSS